jgi:alkylated DNA repair dioxygenase AlkB
MREIVPGISLAEPLGNADEMLARLEREVIVDDEIVDLGDGPVTMPRLTGWYGDAEAIYTYTGVTNIPRPWTPTLQALRDQLDAALATRLNSCLIGVYRDGASAVDWHTDDEPELRDRIVSVSLGTTRTFQLRAGDAGAPLAVPLTHGSVLVMTVASQRTWQHAVPPEPASGPRMNLTFRTIALR